MSIDRSTIRLRPVEPRDEGFLRLLYAESRRQELDQVAWPEGAREQFLTQQFDAQDAHYRSSHYAGAELSVIERDGESVGRLYVRRAEAEIRIMDIALVPAAQGQGIGTMLLKQLLEEGRTRGSIVSIHVEKFNPALRLYQRLGFRPSADRGVYLFLEWTPPARAEAAAAANSSD